GWRRRIAVPVARVILRAARLVTIEQSAFNHLVVSLVRMLAHTVEDQVEATSARVDTLTDGVAKAMAQSRAVPELVDAVARASGDLRALRERLGGLGEATGRPRTCLPPPGPPFA